MRHSESSPSTFYSFTLENKSLLYHSGIFEADHHLFCTRCFCACPSLRCSRIYSGDFNVPASDPVPANPSETLVQRTDSKCPSALSRKLFGWTIHSQFNAPSRGHCVRDCHQRSSRHEERRIPLYFGMVLPINTSVFASFSNPKELTP